jgi:hypothetical protein
MYYNEVRQPDGTSVIGINYDEERPNILEVLPTIESQQQQQQPEYQIFKLDIVYWLNLFTVVISIYYTLIYDNIISTFNCLACILPLHSTQNNNIYGIIVYTVYIIFTMLLTAFLGIYEYIWYYFICNVIIMCIFLTSVTKYVMYIRNQNQTINEHVI